MIIIIGIDYYDHVLYRFLMIASTQLSTVSFARNGKTSKTWSNDVSDLDFKF